MLVTLSDKKVGHDAGNGTFDYYNADIITANDYYPGGMQMPGRKYSQPNSNYRYGFNGQEKSTEINGSENLYTAEYWEYDSRLGRRWNVDPIMKEYESPYLCFSGNPIFYSDILGNEANGGGDDDKKPKKTATDAGHGINGDSGAQSKDKKHTEQELALKVETETDKALKSFGIDNTRTRTTENAKSSIAQVKARIKTVKDADANILVSHHFNDGGDDILILYHPSKTNENRQNSSAEYENNSLKLANYVKEELSKVYTDGRQIKIVPGTKPNIRFNQLGLLKANDKAGNAGLLLELGDVNSAKTITLVTTNAPAIGNAIATAMYRYMNNGSLPPQAAAVTTNFVLPTIVMPPINLPDNTRVVKPIMNLKFKN